VSPLPQGRVRGTSKKRKGVEASVPARIKKSPGLVARTSNRKLQKSVGDVWPRISSTHALQKERSGSSERGPSSERKSAGETVGGRVERNVRRESASPLKTGEDRRKTQGGERSSSSGLHIAKSGAAVAGPGLKGHRILRRVPADGRHPGSSRGVGFHEKASTVVLAVSASSDPYEPTKRRTYGQVAAPRKLGEA
jgi:hypothetical protein